MCDCFHAVLPWPGASGGVSGGQLEPQEPGVETEEDHSVSEVPVDELLRPRPQGSSPVCECKTEGSSFGLQEATLGRRGSSERRRSWWKWDSRHSQTPSKMSQPQSKQEAAEVTLQTQVKAGASGYSITGGGDQGIFIKQVLKESPAARLFSLQTGDQLLSTTVFFDEIKYEDALKILQYSEPYRVQFKVRRRLPAREAEGCDSSSGRGALGEGEQDKDAICEWTKAQTKMLQGDTDQERLISQPRERRGRRPQKDRCSWPKFQALPSKQGPRPRRSHSTSEAYKCRDASDMCPDSVETEAQTPGQGGQRTRKFLNLRLKMGLGQGLSMAGEPGRAGLGNSGSEATKDVADHQREKVPAVPGARPHLNMYGLPEPVEGAVSMAVGAKPQSRTKDRTNQRGVGAQGEGDRRAVQSQDTGMSRRALEEPAQRGDARSRPPETHIRMHNLKIPRFRFCQEKELQTERQLPVPQAEEGWGPGRQELEASEAKAKAKLPGWQEGSPDPAGTEPGTEEGGRSKQRAERVSGVLEYPGIPPTGPAGPEDTPQGGGQGDTGIKARARPTTESKGKRNTEYKKLTPSENEIPHNRVGQEQSLEDREGTAQGGKLRNHVFKKPSWRSTTTEKGTKTSLYTSMKRAGITQKSIKDDVDDTEISVQRPSSDLQVQPGHVDVNVPEGQVPEAELMAPQASAAGLKVHVPTVQVPGIRLPTVELKGPKVELEGPKVDVKGAKGKVTAPDLEVSLPSIDGDMQAPDAKVEPDLALGDKDVATKDKKFKMPKFKMPFFGASTPKKSLEASVGVETPKFGADASLPTLQGDVKTPDLSVQRPSSDLQVQPGHVDVNVPEGQVPEAELMAPQASAAGLKVHLPTVQVPGIRLPTVELQGPQVDVKGAKGEMSMPGELDVPLPSVDVDFQAPSGKLGMDTELGNRDMSTKDGKFKMPKFKMPSFGASAACKATEASVDVTTPKVEADLGLSTVQGDVKTPDLSVQRPSSDLQVQPGHVDVNVPEGQVPEAELMAPQASAAGLKVHVPTVQVPGIRLPTVELQGPQVELEGAKVDVKGAKGKVTAPDLEVSLPSVHLEIRAPDAEADMDTVLGDKDASTKDSKFKMPKFKMPSFGASAACKATEASVDVTTPKVEADLGLSTMQGDVKTPDLSVQRPSSDLQVQPGHVDVNVPEGQVPEAELTAPQASAAGLKVHLPTVQVPGIRQPTVEFEGPQADVKGAKGKVTAPDLEVSLPSIDGDMQAPGAKVEPDLALGDKDVATKDKKFKMPKFKMPSFGASTPKKSLEASVGVETPKFGADASLPTLQGYLKAPNLSVQRPSSDLQVQPGHVDVNVPEGQVPEAELMAPQASAAGLKVHLPTVQVPGIRLPTLELQGPQVHVKGAKVDVKGAKGEMSMPGELDVPLPSVDVDFQAPSGKLGMDTELGNRDMSTKDGKFKMPKFKMPSFGASAACKATEASVDVTTPKVEADLGLSTVQGDVKTPDLSVQRPSSDLQVQPGHVDVNVPEGQVPEAELTAPQASAAGLKVHVPTVQVPGIRLPTVELQGPQVELEGAKVDVKGAKGMVTAPDLEVSLPSVHLEIRAPDAEADMDTVLGDKDASTKDSKFKMPKFKMPSFGASAACKATEASVDVTTPKVEADLGLSTMQGDVKTPDLSVQRPSSDLQVQPGHVDVNVPEGQVPEAELTAPQASAAGLKVHLPTVQVPGIRQPTLELKGPQADVKGAKGKVTAPDLEVSLPSIDGDMQAPGAKVEPDLALGDKDVATKDKKFKMPKFKMPSFGASTPKKSLEASVGVETPKFGADASLPTLQGYLKAPNLSVQRPSSDLQVQPGHVDVNVPDGQVPEAELMAPQASAAGLKVHLPTVQVPGIRLPTVELQGPQVHVKGAKVDVKGAKGEMSMPGELDVPLPSVDVDFQAPSGKLGMDTELGNRDMSTKDGKFKMPKFKMPSFGASAACKATEASVDVTTPKVEADLGLSTLQGDVKTPDLSVQRPSSDLQVQPGHVDVNVPEGQVPEAELTAPQASAAGLKVHLPTVQVPSIRLPTVELQGPQVHVKGAKVDVKGAKGEMSMPGELDVPLPSVDVDFQAPSGKLGMDTELGNRDMSTKDGKFKMPKFKMPSFGASAACKATEASVDVTTPKVEADLGLSTVQGDVKTPDLSVQRPSSDLQVQPGHVDVNVPEGQVPEAELTAPQASAAGLKVHVPTVQVPGIRQPTVELQGPQVELEGPKVDVKGAKGKVTAPDLEVSLPSVHLEIRAPDAEADMDTVLGDKDASTKDSKFKMPKFKMPSFGASAACKATEASVDVTTPKVEADLGLSTVQGDVKTPDLSVQRPSSDLQVQPGHVDVNVPKGQVPEAELMAPQASAAGLKVHLPTVQMPGIRQPTVELQGPQVDVKGAKGEMSMPGELDVPLPSVDVDFQAPSGKLGMDTVLGDKDVSTKDSKFKMPKFRMPSFGASATCKATEASVDVPTPKVEADLGLSTVQGDVKTPDLSVQRPSSDLQVQPGHVDVNVPEGQVPEVELTAPQASAAGLKVHLPTVQVPGMRQPTLELKGPQVDVKGAKGKVTAPDLEVSLPSIDGDMQAPDAKVEPDLALGDKDVATKDKKFKMPKFKMPSFGASTPKKSLEASVGVETPKFGADASLPTLQGDVKTPDLSVQRPSSDLQVQPGHVDVNVPEGQVPEAELMAPQASAAGLKVHLPTVQVPGIRLPTVELQGPQVDVKGAKGEMSMPGELDVPLPSVDVDFQAPSGKLGMDTELGNRDMSTKDGKFKMPKFKMPSFGASAACKATEASVDVTTPKVEADLGLSTVQGDVKTPDLSVQRPSSDLQVQPGHVDVNVPEGQVPEAELTAPQASAAGLKVHVPTVQVPGIRQPTVELQGPQVELKGPKVDVKGAKGKVTAPDLEVSLPSVHLEIRAPDAEADMDTVLGDKDASTKDSKFKMPKFKMPSFGASAACKATEASVDVPTPKVEADLGLSTVQGDVKTPDLSVQRPSSDLQVQPGHVDVNVPKGQVPEAELTAPQASAAGLKVHVPTVQVPGIRLPTVEFEGPQVDVKGAKGKVTAPDLEVSLPSIDGDMQAPGVKVKPDLSLGDKDVATKDKKFKMPKFKMPSFGASTPKKSLEASVGVETPKFGADASLPTLQGDLKASDLSVQRPSSDLQVQPGHVDVNVPEGQVPEAELTAPQASAAGLKVHLPTVQVPGIRQPTVELKGPKVEFEGPKVDVKGAKGKVTAPDLEVSLPSIDGDMQAPGVKVKPDLSLGDKDVATKDKKFKMPKFKMPSFGASTPKKSLEASVGVETPKFGADASLPTLQYDVKTPDLSVQRPSSDLQVQPGHVDVNVPEGQVPEAELTAPQASAAGLKVHLPTVQVPGIRLPTVELNGPQVDVKGAKGEMSMPGDLDVPLPSVDVDFQAPSGKLGMDTELGNRDMSTKDGKFKMPKFKMPSFGASAACKATEASVDVTTPKVEADLGLSTVQGDVKTPDLSVQRPSSDLQVQPGHVDVNVPEGQVPEAELTAPQASAAGLKVHVPTVQVPGIRQPTVELQGPQVELKGPKVDVKGAKGKVTAPDLEVSLPSIDGDMQAPGAKVEPDLALGDKDVATKDKKFKMPKFKMPSFGASTPKKSLEASVGVETPKFGADASLPTLQGYLKAPNLSVQRPSSDLQVQPGHVDVNIPEGQVPEAELMAPQASAAGLKVHLPTVQVPGIRLPTVELKGPQVELEGPKVDVKGAKGKVTAPDLEVSLPSLHLEISTPDAEADMDTVLGDKDASTKDSKFKMPKFKMPSFGASAACKATEASVDVTTPEVEADLGLSTVQGDVKTPDLSVQRPSSDLQVQPGHVDVNVPKGQVPEAELMAPQASAAGLKVHLPTVQMPGIRQPTVEFEGPQVDVKGAKGEMSMPGELDVPLPSVDVDFQAPSGKLGMDTVLGDKDASTKDSKFKMPKFKMPSFGASAACKATEASVDVTTPKVEADLGLSTVQGDVKTPDLSVQRPSSDLQVQPGHVDVNVPEGQVPEAELTAPQASAAGLKVHLPTVQVPGMRQPTLELKGRKVELEGPKVDVKGAKGKVTAPDLELSLPSVHLEIRAPDAEADMDTVLGDKDTSTKDCKFKMPKFKMPSFGASAACKATEASVDVPTPKVEADLGLSTVQGDVKTPDLSVQRPSSDLQVQPGHVDVNVPEGQVPEAELTAPQASAAGLKVHVPTVQVPGIRQPTGELEGPQVHIPCSQVDLSYTNVQCNAPDLAILLPGLDIQLPSPRSLLEVAASPVASSLPLPSSHCGATSLSVLDGSLKYIQDAASVSQGADMVHATPASLQDDTEHTAYPSLGGESTECRLGFGHRLPPTLPQSSLGSFPGVHTTRLSMDLPKLVPPGLSSASVHASRACTPPSCEPFPLSQHQEPAPQSPDSSALSSTGSSAVPQCHVGILAAQPAAPLHLGDPLVPLSHDQLNFPRLFKPKFGFSTPEADLWAPALQPLGPLPHVAVQNERPPKEQGDKGMGRLPPATASEGQGQIPVAQPEVGPPLQGAIELTGAGAGPRAKLAPAMEGLLQGHCGKLGGRGPEEDPQEDNRTGAEPGGTPGSRFGMPKFHMPGLKLTPCPGRGGALEQGTPSENGWPLPGPQLQADTCPSSPATTAPEGFPATLLEADLPAIHRRPGSGSLPLRGLDTRLPGSQAPREDPGGGAVPKLGAHELLAESWTSLPQGPVRLTVSRTGVPAQVSVVSSEQLWQDSVLTVKFPKLTGPRFSFPGPGSESDVFIPTVRQVPSYVARVDEALAEGCTGLWTAAVLPAATGVFREPPADLDPSSRPPPISKAQVHFQRAPAESPDAILGRAIPTPTNLAQSDTISTQIVRESEIPTSQVQMPSYGFSLLKVRFPGPSKQAAPAEASVPETPQPDTGGPFEMLLSSGCSDEEPAEVLKLPMEDGSEPAAASEPPQQPDSQKSGLWFWLPSIGFSSSVDTTKPVAKAHGPRQAPVQTQPEARPRRHERAGWFRFPKLGFSSSAPKPSPGVEREVGLAGPEPQEEAATFFDAQESFSAEEKEGVAPATSEELPQNAIQDPASPSL